MARPLDRIESMIRNEIKKIAEDFNEINKGFRNLKKLLMDDKTALIVIHREFERHPERFQQFANSVDNKIKNLMEKFKGINSDYDKLMKEAERIKGNLQSQYQQIGQRSDDTSRLMQQTDAYFSTALTEKDSTNRENLIQTFFDHFYNIVDSTHLSMQRHMATILSYYNFRFKIYRQANQSG